VSVLISRSVVVIQHVRQVLRHAVVTVLSSLLFPCRLRCQAVGLTMAVDRIEEFREMFARSVEPMVRGGSQRIRAEAELPLSSLGRHFFEQLLLLEPFGEGNRPPTFSIRMAEVLSVRNKWARIR
jgi:single-stranded DNA-specific DHH superfamily exonuclease